MNFLSIHGFTKNQANTYCNFIFKNSDHETHERIKKERYDFETTREEIIQYE